MNLDISFFPNPKKLFDQLLNSIMYLNPPLE